MIDLHAFVGGWIAGLVTGASLMRWRIRGRISHENINRTLAFTVQGLNWPATLGDFTLVGPVNNEGAWRWYERHHNGTTERIRVDHQLQLLGSPHHQ